MTMNIRLENYPKDSSRGAKKKIDEEGARLFLAKYSNWGYRATEARDDRLINWIRDRGGALTLFNLECAHHAIFGDFPRTETPATKAEARPPKADTEDVEGVPVEQFGAMHRANRKPAAKE